jgi:hypothetical protein
LYLILVLANGRRRISTYNLNAIGFSVLFYEFFSVLDWEISRFWGAPISWSTILFFVNRYGTLLGNIPVVFEKFWTTPGTSDKIRVRTAASGVEKYI